MTTQPLTRREFLYYVWAASIALFTAEAGGAVLWFALPRFKPGEFGSTFTIPVEDLPPPDSPPAGYNDGRFWLVTVGPQSVSDPLHPTGYATQPGLLALYKVCVHLGCLYRWEDTLGRFKCPCHASQYLRDGTRVHGPATRDLDKFVIKAVDADGNVLAATRTGEADADPSAGQAIRIPDGAAALVVDTGKRIRGRWNAGANTAPD